MSLSHRQSPRADERGKEFSWRQRRSKDAADPVPRNSRIVSFILLALFALFGTTFAQITLKSEQLVQSVGNAVLPRNDGRSLVWIKAETCCPGCNYVSECCCSPRNGPVTIRKTRTRSVTRIAGSKLAAPPVTRKPAKTTKRRLAGADTGELHSSTAEAHLKLRDLEPEDVKDEDATVRLEERAPGRHLCPVCPNGVKLSTASGNNGSPMYCCPKRTTKTIFRTVSRTVTQVPTPRTTKPAVVRGDQISLAGTAYKGSLITAYAVPVSKQAGRQLTNAKVVGTAQASKNSGQFSLLSKGIPFAKAMIYLTAKANGFAESQPWLVGTFSFTMKPTTTSTTKTKVPFPATITAGVGGAAPMPTVPCSTRASAYGLPDVFPGVPKLYLNRSISGPFTCILTAATFENSKAPQPLSLQLAGTSLEFPYPTALTFVPSSFAYAGTVTLSWASRSAAVPIRQTTISARLPSSGTTLYQGQWWQHQGTWQKVNYTISYAFAGGWTSLQRTPVLQAIGNLATIVGKQWLPSGLATGLSNVTFVSSLPAAGTWSTSVSIDTGGPAIPFGNRIAFILRTSAPKTAAIKKAGTVAALSWTIAALGLKIGAIFRAAGMTAVWELPGISTNMLCGAKTKYPQAASVNLLRIPLTAKSGNVGYLAGQISTVTCAAGVPKSFKGSVSYTRRAAQWKSGISVKVDLQEASLVGQKDILPLVSAAWFYNDGSKLYTFQGATQVFALITGTNVTNFVNASVTYTASANWGATQTSWLSDFKLIVISSAAVVPLSSSFPLKNTIGSLKSVPRVFVPLYQSNTMTSFAFSYQPHRIVIAGLVNYGGVVGALNMTFVLPAASTGAATTKHLLTTNATIGNVTVGQITVQLGSMPCQPLSYPATLDFRQLPTVRIMRPTGVSDPMTGFEMHIPTPLTNSSVLFGIQNTARTQFVCSAGSYVHGIATSGPIALSALPVTLLISRISLKNTVVSFATGNDYVTLGPFTSPELPGVSLNVYLPLLHNENRNLLAPSKPLWEVSGLTSYAMAVQVAQAVIGPESSQYYLAYLNSLNSSVLRRQNLATATNITFGHFQQFNQTTKGRVQIYSYSHTSIDALTGKPVTWSVKGSKVETIVIVSRVPPATRTTTTRTTRTASTSVSAASTLQVSSFKFAYNFAASNARINLAFQSGYDACLARIQSATVNGQNLPALGNLSVTGTTIFTCQANNSQVTSFFTKMSAQQYSVAPLGASLNLTNVSMSVSCLPSLQSCGVPGGFVGSQQYLWTSALNLSSWQQSNNLSSVMNMSLVNSTVFPALAQAIPPASSFPSFVLNNSLAYAMLYAKSSFSLPSPSFLCPSNFTGLCNAPQLAVSGTLQLGSLPLGYAAQIDWTASKTVSQVQQQTIAGRLNQYGVFVVSIQGNLCQPTSSDFWATLGGLPFNIRNLTRALGNASFSCNNLTSPTSFGFAFTLPSISVNLTLLSPGTVFLTAATVRYTSLTDMLGFYTAYSGSPISFGIQFPLHSITPSISLSATCVSSSCTVTDLLAFNGTGSLSPYYHFFQGFSLLPFGSMTSLDRLQNLSVTWVPSSGTLSLLASKTISIGSSVSLSAGLNVSARYGASGGGWALVQESSTIAFNFTSQDAVTLSSRYVPCQMSGAPSALQSSGPLQLSGLLSLNLPGIGLLRGTCSLNFTCASGAQANISKATFSATLPGPFNISLFGGYVTVNSIALTYTTATGSSSSGTIAIQARFSSTVVTLTYQMTSGSPTLASISFTQSAGAISPFDPGFPFAAYWVDVLGAAQVAILAKDVVVSGLSLTYNFGTSPVGNDSFTIAGTVSFGSITAALSIAANQRPSGNTSTWIATKAQMTIGMTPYGTLTFSGGSPCASPAPFRLKATLNDIGPLTSFQGSGSLFLNCFTNGTISSYIWNVQVSSMTLTAFGTNQSVAGSVSYNSSSSVLTVTGGPLAPGSWTLSANVTTTNTSLWSFSFVSSGAQAFSSLPFASGMGSEFTSQSSDLSSLVSGKMATVMVTYDNYPGSLVFFGSFAAASGSYAVNASISVIMSRNAVTAPWLISVQIPFSSTFTIAGFGIIGLYGDLACPSGNIDAYALFNIPSMSAIMGNGTLSYLCSPGGGTGLSAVQSYNVSLQVTAVNLTLFGEHEKLTNVVVSYTSSTGALSVSGAASLRASSVSATVKVSADFVLLSTGSQFIRLQLSLQVGSTNILGNTLPFGNFVSGAVNGSGQSLVTPNAAMGSLLILYQSSAGTSQTLAVTATIQDGSLSGKLQLNLISSNGSSWKAVSGSVAVDLGTYGQLVLSGTNPCPAGTVDLAANLSIPVLGSMVLQGYADFVCNGTNAIVGYVGQISDLYTFNLLGGTEQINATLAYDSLTGAFGLTTDFGQAVRLAYSLFAASNYSVSFGVNGTASFAQVPFASQLGSLVDSVATTSGGSLSTFQLLGAYFEYQHPYPNGSNQTIFFTCAVDDAISSAATGTVNVTLSFEKATSSAPYVNVNSSVTAALQVDDIVNLVFSFDPACPASAVGSVSATFLSLPFGLPPFTATGTITFGCKGSSVNYSDYTLSLQAGFTTPLSFSFLGDKISIPTPTISYQSAIDVFNLGWSVSPSFSLNIGFGKGLGSSPSSSAGSGGSSASFKWPFSLQGLPVGKVNIQSIINDLASILDSFDSVFGGGFDFGFSSASSFEQDIFGPLNGLSLSNVVINLDSAAGGIHLNADVNFWGFGTQFHMISPKSGGGSYSMLYGVTLFTPGTTGNFASGLSWLDAIFNPGHGFSFQNVVFAIASGGGTYSFNGLTVSAQGTGLIMSGELLLQGGGMTSIVSSTGSFGNQLGAMGQGSAYLDFAVAVTESSVQLAIDFSSDMSAGGQSFTQVALVFSTLFQAPQLQFDFAFTYSRVLGGQSLLFLGEFGLQLNDLGGNLNGMFLFEGAWKNPFGLCSQMTIYTIGLSLSLNLETMLPDAFGMVISGQLGQVNVSGQLLVDAATPDTGNAVALSATNLSLGNIVIAFISDIPSWMYDVLNSMSVASVVFSFNPSTTAAQFSPDTPSIPPGLFLNVTNFKYLDIVIVQSAIIKQSGSTLAASIQIAPITFGSLFAVTSYNNPNKGPYGSFLISPSLMKISYSGAVSMWGFKLGSIGQFQVDPLTGSSVANLTLSWNDGYGDTVTINLVESTGGYTSGNWAFGITFSLYSTNAGGFFAGVVQAFGSWLSNELNSIQSQVTTAVNAEAQTMINDANAAFQSAVTNLDNVESDINNALSSAESAVNSAQNAVNSVQSTCNGYSNGYHWYSPWNCVAYAGCEVGLGVVQGALWVAQEALDVAEDALDDVIQTAVDGLLTAQTGVDDAIQGGQDLVDGVIGAVTSVVNTLTSQVSSAIGDIFNLVSLEISDTLSSSAQNSFSGSAVFGCFGSAPQPYSFTFSMNSMADTVADMAKNCLEALGQWLASELSDTPAAPFMNEILATL